MEEMATQSSEIIAQPCASDILCGKDKYCLRHEGSRRFNRVVESHQSKYLQLKTKKEKMFLTKEILASLQRTSARFLKFNSQVNGWEEINQIAARDKISHALRHLKPRKTTNHPKRKRQVSERSEPSSSTSKKFFLSSLSTKEVDMYEPLPFGSLKPRKTNHLKRIRQVSESSSESSSSTSEEFSLSSLSTKEVDMYEPLPFEWTNTNTTGEEGDHCPLEFPVFNIQLPTHASDRVEGDHCPLEFPVFNIQLPTHASDTATLGQEINGKTVIPQSPHNLLNENTVESKPAHDPLMALLDHLERSIEL